MECKRCGNKDPTYFYKGHKGYYCRKCIGFSRVLLMEDLKPFDYDVNLGVEEYSFNYELSERQKEASLKCESYIKDSDVLLYCVCGAGKTEISIASISSYLKKGLKVCYAISRKEVVIELEKRFKTIFKNANVISVYGNHHDILNGDLIVCTCHQLYRYYQTFDLLVLDEVDAFPLKGNRTLMNICLRSAKGNIIFSSATIDDDLKEVLSNRNYKTVSLFVRPSNKPLIIPKVFYLNKLLSFFFILYIVSTNKTQIILFVSSKKQCIYLYRLISKFVSCTYVYADLEDRNKNINDFRNKKYQIIVSTTVLERGITIKGVDVIIYDYDFYFDESSLIQMLGRVGRDINNPYGKAYIFTNHFDTNINKTVNKLKQANTYL